jgi:flagellar hook-basal body complex protein FliE
MAFSPIEPVQNLLAGPRAPQLTPVSTPANQVTPANAAQGTEDSGFVGMLQNALGQLNDLAQNADAMATRAATGEDVDLHQVVLSMQSAGLGFQLALQVRNRLVEAYQEITRMQV